MIPICNGLCLINTNIEKWEDWHQLVDHQEDSESKVIETIREDHLDMLIGKEEILSNLGDIDDHIYI